MASNPLSQTRPPGRNKTQVYLIAASVAVVSALLIYLQFARPTPPQELPLTPEARAYIGNLGLADVNMTAKLDYFGQKVVEISGNITNNGPRNLGVVEVRCVFSNYAGQVILRQRSAIVSAKMGGLKPGETKPFRLPFDNIPEGWNQQIPALVIAGIAFE